MAKKKINLDNLNVDLDIKDNAEELLTVNSPKRLKASAWGEVGALGMDAWAVGPL